VPEFIRLEIPSGVPPPAKRRNRLGFIGSHVILDLWGARELGNEVAIERALRDSAAAAGATLLHIHLHRFNTNGGVSGIATLAESHISIHTWPERGYAALDIFMCGDCEPEKAVSVLRQVFSPKFIVANELLRGGGGAVV
jgi:S-adenosylmethionine decarboxylase